MSNVIKLDSHRKPSEARVEDVEEIVTMRSNIYCKACENVEMAITDVTNNVMTVECTDCGASKKYYTEQTTLL